jgi:tetratricopeptide (TPR) repeat protein
MEPLRFKMFFGELVRIAERYCGKGFVRKFRVLIKRQRSKEQYLLKKIKQGKKIQDGEIGYQETIFDVFCTMYEKRLKKDEYLRMSLEIGRLLKKYGEFSKALTMYRRVARKTPKDHILHAEALLRRGDLEIKQNNFREAQRALTKSKELYGRLQSRSGRAQATNELAVNYCEQGRLNLGQRHFGIALEDADRARNSQIASSVTMNLGNVSSIRGNWTEALANYQEVLPRLERRGDTKRLAQTYHNLGLTTMRQGKYRSAVANFDKSLHFLKKVGDYYLSGLVYLGKAEAYASLKDYPLAAGYAQKALEMFNTVGDKLGIADAYKIKGMIHREIKEWDVSEQYFQTSLRINQEIGNALNTAETYFELGLLYKVREKGDKAAESFQLALEQYAKLQSRQGLEKIEREMRTAG